MDNLNDSQAPLPEWSAGEISNFKYETVNCDAIFNETQDLDNLNQDQDNNKGKNIEDNSSFFYTFFNAKKQNEPDHEKAQEERNEVHENKKLIIKKLKMEKPLDLLTKWIYALPSFSKMSCLLILNVHALLFYESKGASWVLLSFFTALARCIELILKPIIAFSSDNATYKLGRRKPFMLFGCGFYSIFLVCIFSPPFSNMSPIMTSLWFGLFYVLFFVADTVSTIPYFALGPELSIDSQERESLYLYVYIFQYAGVIISSVGPVLLQKMINKCDCSHCINLIDKVKLRTCVLECNSQCDVSSNEQSLEYISMLIGFIFTLSFILLCTKIKEKRTIKTLMRSVI